MAKKPVKITDDMTDDEVAAVKAEAAVEVTAEVTAGPTVTTNKQAEPFFVTSMNQGSLIEANKLARDQRAAEQAVISDAYRAAIEAVNRAFSTLTPVMTVEEAAALRK